MNPDTLGAILGISALIVMTVWACCTFLWAWCAINVATSVFRDFLSARNSTDARIKRSLRDAERHRIRAVILGGAVK